MKCILRMVCVLLVYLLVPFDLHAFEAICKWEDGPVEKYQFYIKVEDGMLFLVNPYVQTVLYQTAGFCYSRPGDPPYFETCLGSIAADGSFRIGFDNLSGTCRIKK